MFTKIKYKLLFYFLVMGIIPLASLLVYEYFSYQDALKEKSFNQLKTVHGIKKRDLESYFLHTREELILFSQSKMVIDATNAFKKSFFAIDPTEASEKHLDKLKLYYFNEFRSNVQTGEKDTIDYSRLVPKNPQGVFLQTQFLIDNKSIYKPLPYHMVHDEFHGVLSDFMNLHGLADLMIIDDETGTILYSVNKEVDFATNLLDGPYANTNLGKLFRKVRFSGISRQTILCDFERYLPSYLAPAAFMATPIFDGDKKTGTLIFQIPIDKMDAITTNRKIWKEEGYGETGECYVVGKDCRLRTNSRFIIENPANFIITLKQNHYDSSSIELIDFYKTTVLFQARCNESYLKSGAGLSGVTIVNDYRNKEVLSVFSSLNIADVNWSIVAEMDTSEAFAPIVAYKKRALWSALAILVLLIVTTFWISNTIYKPINALADGAREIANGNLDVSISVNTRDEFKLLAVIFNKGIRSLKENRDVIMDSNNLLEEQKEEIITQAERLGKLNEEMQAVNSHLDQLVAERTAELKRQNKKLIEYAFFNAHQLRAPVVNILGLMNVMKLTTSEEEKSECLALLEKATQDLDRVIHEIQAILDEGEFGEEAES